MTAPLSAPERDELMSAADEGPQIAVIIPCFRVADSITEVLAGIGDICQHIYVVDDGCPEGTGKRVQAEIDDPRVRVLFHDHNRGVGAAVMTGYAAALSDGATVMVKLDGDGQMDPEEIPRLVAPILCGDADYAKGNRFYDLRHIRRMPTTRLLGNAALSFISKLSSGYWDIFDPTNGFTAIHALIARELPFERLAPHYFFESDMLYRLGLLRARVLDIPMHARYGKENSSLRIRRIVLHFAVRHALNFVRRIFFNYFLRDFSAASVQLLLGLPLLMFGVIYGSIEWIAGVRSGVGAYSGAVMLAALPVIVGMQMLLAFLSFDVARVPQTPIHPRLDRRLPETVVPRLRPRGDSEG